MTKCEAWDYLVTRYPEFKTRGAHFALEGVKDFFSWVWERSEENTYRQMNGAAGDYPDVIKDLFDKVSRR